MDETNIISSLQQNLSLQEVLQCQIRHIPIKRAFDILFSLAVLILGLPIFFLIAIAIRLTSRGKIIYSHERIGRGGIPFKCYKFRTMRKDADKRLKSLLENNPILKHEWEALRKLKNDPRITYIGSFLRKTSLDEIPQFWNVLKGDLSIVGPRPVVKAELIKYYKSKASKILSIRPGLTGLWQVSGRSDTSYQTRISLDEQYIDNQSIAFDLKLIIKTLPAILNSKGAY